MPARKGARTAPDSDRGFPVTCSEAEPAFTAQISPRVIGFDQSIPSPLGWFSRVRRSGANVIYSPVIRVMIASQVTACPVLLVTSTSRWQIAGSIIILHSLTALAVVPPAQDVIVFQTEPAAAAAGVVPLS